MNTQQLQNEKLRIINWISQLEDFSLVEKVKAIMSSSDKPYILTNEQQKILENQIGLDHKLYTEADKLYDALRSKYEL